MAGPVTYGPAQPALSIPTLYGMALNAGFTGQSAVTITAIAQAESAGIPNAWNPGKTLPGGGTTENSFGVLQFNANAWGAQTAQAALDPQTAFNQAYSASNGGANFSTWGAYTNGSYQQYVAPVSQAASALPSASPAPGGVTGSIGFADSFSGDGTYSGQSIPGSAPITYGPAPGTGPTDGSMAMNFTNYEPDYNQPNMVFGGSGPGGVFGTLDTGQGNPGIGADLGAASGVGSLGITSQTPLDMGATPDIASAQNPATSMAPTPGGASSSNQILSGDWGSMGVTAVTTGADTQATAAAKAAQTVAQATTNAANSTDTTNTNLVQSTLAAGSTWLAQAGVIFFGLVFLAGGVWFFSRQEA
jgi:hypothetical protein